MADSKKVHRRQWRDYRTAAGGRPVKAFLAALTDEEVAEVIAGMKDIAGGGVRLARHLRGDIYEVRADATNRSFRLLFAAEGRFGHVLLSLSCFEKRTQKTPPREIDLAVSRLTDWRQRGTARKKVSNRARQKTS
ncbi:MAG TPA: type II toxin-antitoxin system RelE/ParE family toxin [Myxococcales bacterium]|nr:type II toxin-antitoxin system RelE/ParE family toxin [Myxococcales bacterium]